MYWWRFLAYQCLFIVGAWCSSLTFNAALKRNATQSSLFASHTTADKGTDGNLDSYFGNGACASTAHYDYTPWWRVDLGRNYHVTDVLVTNRLNSADRLHDFNITVSADDGSPSTLCGVYPGSAPSSETVTVSCDQFTWGRFVTITKPTEDFSDILTLCEVQVMAVDRSHMVFERQIGRNAIYDATATMTTDLPSCIQSCQISGCLAVQYNENTDGCQLFKSTDSTEVNAGNSWKLFVFWS